MTLNLINLPDMTYFLFVNHKINELLNMIYVIFENRNL